MTILFNLSLTLSHHIDHKLPGSLVQWLKLPAWEDSDLGFVRRSGKEAKKQMFLPSLIRKDSILWGASVTERQRACLQTAEARILNSVSGV